MLDAPPYVQRIVDRDAAELWAQVTPDCARRVLLAALDAFATLGFAGATTREIATRGHMSPADVYVDYAAKVDLLQQIMEIAHRDLWEAVRDGTREAETASDRLRAFAEAFATWHMCNYTLARVVDNELRALPADRMEQVRLLRRQIDSTLWTELRRGVAEEGFAVPDVGDMAVAVISLCAAVERWHPLRRASVDVPQLARMYGDLVLRMVRPWTSAPSGRAAQRRKVNLKRPAPVDSSGL